MKRFFVLILTLVLAAALASCEGIGDGALTNGLQASGSDVIEAQDAEKDCVLTVYDSQGNGSYRVRIPVAEMSELMEIIIEGEYAAVGETSTPANKYVLIDFPSKVDLDSNTGVYNDVKVYFDGFVAEINPTESPLGRQAGIYDRVIQFMNEANKEVSNAEYNAGFDFDTLLVCASAVYDFKVSDFEDIGCIGVKSLMDTNDGKRWWTFTFDASSEAQIRDIASKLKSRSEITSVEFNIFYTLD